MTQLARFTHDRTRDVAPPLRDPLLRGRGDRIFREHYRLLVDPA